MRNIFLATLAVAGMAVLPGCEYFYGYGPGGSEDEAAQLDAQGQPGGTNTDGDVNPGPGPSDSCNGPDTDGDGWYTGGAAWCDCDDTNPKTHPGAVECPDGEDNDCDGTVDENDGYRCGDGGDAVDNDKDGYVAGLDCDDNDPTVFPGAPELCDGIVNDCNAAALPVDEVDDDGDAYVECTIDGGGWDGDPGVVGGEDCDDTDADRFPGNPEVCDGEDNDCDGHVPETETDDDGDGLAECEGDLCDSNPDTFGACENLPDFDDDGDCYCEVGPCTGSSDPSCVTVLDGDCDDTCADWHPGATPICDVPVDHIDDNCDGIVDGISFDDDLDGLTECEGDCDDADDSVQYCDGDADGDGFEADVDCDDTDPTVYPGATELCDGIQNDCDALEFPADELDDDQDGFMVCEDDCDDTDDTINPDATDTCGDGVDSDCDDTTCPEDSVIDGDGDGYDADEDCDDSDSDINPGETDTCGDGVDSDCDDATCPEDSFDIVLLTPPVPAGQCGLELRYLDDTTVWPYLRFSYGTGFNEQLMNSDWRAWDVTGFHTTNANGFDVSLLDTDGVFPLYWVRWSIELDADATPGNGSETWDCIGDGTMYGMVTADWVYDDGTRESLPITWQRPDGDPYAGGCQHMIDGPVPTCSP